MIVWQDEENSVLPADPFIDDPNDTKIAKLEETTDKTTEDNNPIVE